MPFHVKMTANGDYFEVVMEKGTVWRGRERRIASCYHRNDADTICELLNKAEKDGELLA